MSDAPKVLVGVEVHLQLKTKTKCFSPSAYHYGADPNTLIDPVVMGLPGALPVLNREAVRLAIRTGLADLAELVRSRGGDLAQQLVAGVFGVVNALVFIVVVPVVAFYLLLDWDRMVARIDELLTQTQAQTEELQVQGEELRVANEELEALNRQMCDPLF